MGGKSKTKRVEQVKESELQKAVARYLNDLESYGHLAWNHPPNGFNANAKEWNRMMANGAKQGQPDCEIFLKGGKTIFIELKTVTGDISKAQEARAGLLSKMGFETHCVIAESPVDAVNQVEKIILEAQHG